MSDIKKHIEFFKENKEIIILIPTLFGGLYQVLNIVILVGLPYVRYFSVSQVIPDGLLLIIATFCVYPLYRLLLKVYNDFIKATPQHSKPRKIGYSVVASPLGCYLLYLAYHTNNITHFFEFLMRYFVFILGILFVLSSIKIILSTIFKCNKFQIKNIIEENSYYLAVVILVFSLSIICWVVPNEIRVLNNLFIKADNFKNYSYFSREIKKTYKMKDDPILLYINKDYAFFKISENEDKILVLDAKSLTEIKTPTK